MNNSSQENSEGKPFLKEIGQADQDEAKVKAATDAMVENIRNMLGKDGVPQNEFMAGFVQKLLQDKSIASLVKAQPEGDLAQKLKSFLPNNSLNLGNQNNDQSGS